VQHSAVDEPEMITKHYIKLACSLAGPSLKTIVALLIKGI